jgi:hypothetical protein
MESLAARGRGDLHDSSSTLRIESDALLEKQKVRALDKGSLFQ